MKMSIKNKIIKKHFDLLKSYEFQVRHKFVDKRIYSASGVVAGKITLFADKKWILEDKFKFTIDGEWSSSSGEIKILDHWLVTNDNGNTFFSHLLKLELINSGFNYAFGNSSSKVFENARNAYEVPRFKSRDTDFLEWIPKNGIVAELGVETGTYAKKIFEITKPKELHLVDVWDSISDPWPSREQQSENYTQILQTFEAAISKRQIIVNKGDDISYLLSLPDNYLDWIYIDSSHAYEHTLQELITSDLKVKPGGFICGHDYVDNQFGRRSGFGVIKAVNQFINTSDWRLIYLTEDREPTFVLKKFINKKQ